MYVRIMTVEVLSMSLKKNVPFKLEALHEQTSKIWAPQAAM